MQQSEHQIPNAVEQLQKEYEAQNRPFYRVEREYYSTGGIRFLVDGAGPITVAGQYDRYILKAAKGQFANLFSYKNGDTGQAANLLISAGAAGLPTDLTHTNLVAGYQTNGEDFAIMGVGLQYKGTRIQMTPGGNFPTSTTSATFKAGVTNGSIYLTDTSSDFLPPEASSPLVLEDSFSRLIAKNLDLRELWNQKEGDQIALARALGPGGGESFLHALGDPSTHNIKRLSKGLIWRNVGTPNAKDVNFAVQATLQEDQYIKVTWPGTTVFGSTFGPLVELDIDFQIILHGVAFYVPSGNV